MHLSSLIRLDVLLVIVIKCLIYSRRSLLRLLLLLLLLRRILIIITMSKLKQMIVIRVHIVVPLDELDHVGGARGVVSVVRNQRLS